MQILKLSDKYFNKTVKLIRNSDPSIHWSDKQILECFNTKNYLVIGMVDDNSLLSVSIFSYVLDTADLLYICVDNTHRNNKIAFKVFENGIIGLENMFITQIFLEVNINNHSAYKLYDNLGFKKISVRKNYYKISNSKFKDALIMKYGI